MTNGVNSLPNWWGNFTFHQNEIREWQIGPLRLLIRFLDTEWQIAYERLDEIDNHWDIKNSEQPPESLDNNARYIFSRMEGNLTITPLLADRPIISRPTTPFNLTAGEETTLYVSSPVWLNIAVNSPDLKPIKEVAIQRPSDTWFGPSTLEGELCYASTTHCRIHLDELPYRPHRAITPVVIRNQADTTLAIERINVPVPFLSLYTDGNGAFWTPRVTLTREQDGGLAALVIDGTPPQEAVNAVLLQKPRMSESANVLIRAFNTVFS